VPNATAPAPIVTAERLSKTFRVKVWDSGMTGALVALLRPRYRDVRAVRDVTFQIDPGEIVAFLGPSPRPRSPHGSSPGSRS
jgi:ABC-2 type transport system ATP-binding protein